ncbi:12263_t:CDS:2 [Funneliformis geosporum]|uniref:12263_t:CDS:1 n=1 Tax=Funneliformis geosporum TaxID=1117311 RepID=A0A9W4WQ01_9GLOM|nr:12263_t:CDS:2 [Funneliformis geosporum]
MAQKHGEQDLYDTFFLRFSSNDKSDQVHDDLYEELSSKTKDISTQNI